MSYKKMVKALGRKIKRDLVAAAGKWDLGIILFLALICLFLQSHLLLVMKNEMASNRREGVLIKEILARNWEIRRARVIKKDHDILRAKWAATGIQYQTWAAIAEAVWDFAPGFRLDPMKVMAIIERESYFDPKAKSFKNGIDAEGNPIRVPLARGLMQINFSVWKKSLKLDESKIHQIRYNIWHGMKIWRGYIDYCGGDESKALLMYWAGFNPPDDSYLKRIESSRFYPKEGGK
jgi:soluble lytic murein transglycosylase-like protein